MSMLSLQGSSSEFTIPNLFCFLKAFKNQEVENKLEGFDAVSAKVHLVVTADDSLFSFCKVITNEGSLSDRLFSELDEIVKMCPQGTYRKKICFDLDVFPKIIDGQCVSIDMKAEYSVPDMIKERDTIRLPRYFHIGCAYFGSAEKRLESYVRMHQENVREAIAFLQFVETADVADKGILSTCTIS